MALIDSMRALPYIDSNRVYITGLSMGGMATWEIYGANRAWFAAAPFVEGLFTMAKNQFLNTACIRIYHGEKTRLSYQFSRDIYKALKIMEQM